MIQSDKFKGDFPSPDLYGEGKIFIKNEYIRKNRFRKKDALITSYRDMDTGEKHVEITENPMFDVYIYDGKKPLTFLHKHIPIEQCRKISVPYKDKVKHIAKEVGLMDLYNERRSEGKWDNLILKEIITESMQIFGAEDSIEESEKLKFFDANPGNLKPKSFRKTASDIEIDTELYKRRGIHLPNVMSTIDDPTVPVNMISTYHADINRAVLWLLVYPENKASSYYKEHTPDELAKTFMDKINETIIIDTGNKLGKRFKEEILPNMELDVRVFEDEAELIYNYFSHVNVEAEVDFVLFWNAGFDIQYLKARFDHIYQNCSDRYFAHPKVPEELRNIYIRDSSVETDRETGEKKRVFTPAEDRHDLFKISGPVNYLDACSMYFSLRATVPNKAPNAKLDTVIQHELGIGKIDIAKYGYTISDIFHKDPILAAAYSIVDVVPLGFQESVNDDIGSALVFTEGCVLEDVTSTVAKTTGSVRLYLRRDEQLLGPNINYNRFEPFKARYTEMITRKKGDLPDREFKELYDKLAKEPQEEFYHGGIVGNVKNNDLLGSKEEDYNIMIEDINANYGRIESPLPIPDEFVKLLAFHHKYSSNREQEMVMDFDFKSEYPSMICSFNIGEMTFMFRMRRIGNQWVGLTGTARYDNISNVVEAYTSRDWFTLTNDYFGFPNAKEIVRRFVREALVA